MALGGRSDYLGMVIGVLVPVAREGSGWRTEFIDGSFIGVCLVS